MRKRHGVAFGSSFSAPEEQACRPDNSSVLLLRKARLVTPNLVIERRKCA
jgi:hypothetical protein